MMHYLRYCCAMFFALISFLLATSQRVQAQNREAYVNQSANGTTLTFYYDDQRATRTGRTWGIEETKKWSSFPAWVEIWNVPDGTTTRVVFDASFRDFRPTTTAVWFLNYHALKRIEGLEYLNTQNVTDMSGMFDGCRALSSLDLSHFNTQNVTNMRRMFDGCRRLTSLDLSHFNTQNVTDMSNMFAGCSGLTSLDLSHFNTQNVTSMFGMFYGCSGLPSLDLSHFNTQNVTNMVSMFSGCSGLTSLDLSHFNTQNVTDMGSMFSYCSGLTSLDLSHFNTQNVTNMCGMFSYCSGLTSLDLSHFNTQNVTDMREMFSYCSALTTINSNTAWQCPRSGGMFAYCTQLKGAEAYDEKQTDAKMANPETGYFTRSNDGSVKAYVVQSTDKTTLTFYYDDQRATRAGKSWGIKVTIKVGYNTFPAWAGTFESAESITTRVVFDASFRDFRPTTTARWFLNLRALKQIEGLEYLNTQNVTDMSSMFSDCRTLTSLDLKNFNTQNVTDMGGMFRDCSGLTSLDLSHFNTQNVTDMGGMFRDCSGLTSLDLSHFNTQNVTNMCGMFFYCSGLTSLDLSHFNTQNVTDMREMFSYCSALTSIRCNTDWNCPQSRNMFEGCTQLKGAVAYDKYKTDDIMANPETGYFTAKSTAVESVRFGADDAQHIYTLQGKRVRGAWKHLPAGVYVVNGKRTVKP